MKIKLIAIVGVVMATVAACSNTVKEKEVSDSEQATSQVAGAANSQAAANSTVTLLPPFKVTAMDGSIVNLADLKGKKVFVNLWATWCPPCRAEIPSIEALSSKVDKQKVAFVMLSLDENFELAKEFANTNKLQLPVFYPAEDLPAIFKTDGIPATFIFNEKGELIKQNLGGAEYNTDEYVKLLKW